MSRWMIMLVLMLLAVGIAAAQADCPTVVEQALNNVDVFCDALGRNQACYGNARLTAEPRPEASAFQFEQEGDIVALSDLAQLQAQPLDPSSGQWGVALMQVQATLPDTVPGQNVTILVFGNVRLSNAAVDNQRPMQSFVLETGMNDSGCTSAPESGLLVQTPHGAGLVEFTVNGMRVQLGSTVLFQAQPNHVMRVTAVEGAAVVSLGSDQVPVLAGMRADIPLDAALRYSGAPVDVQPYTADLSAALPLRVLQRPINAAPPLTTLQLAEVILRQERHAPLCAADHAFLPTCEHLPSVFHGDPCANGGCPPQIAPPQGGGSAAPPPAVPQRGGQRGGGDDDDGGNDDDDD